MEVYGASALASISSISPSLHSSHQPTSVCGFRRVRVWCVKTDVNGSSQSLKGNQMTVSITGATGFIGQRLVQRLHEDNHSICVLTRSRSKAQSIFPVKDFPGIVIAEEPQWKDCIQGSTGVVNLAGLPINQERDQAKQDQSHLKGTSETQVFDERSPSGNDYLAEVCREWEGTALGVDKDVRLSLIRIGVVLGKDGVINGTAPNPVRLAEMCEHLGSALGRPSWLPVPDLALKAVLGEGAIVVLEGQRVVPVRAKELGFSYKYPFIKEALKAILAQKVVV
ncbi:protein of unknown function DUF1731, C-terminal [Cynara cardunculus var. scolymus]|uniref:NAD(P)-binding domain-containing protein n=1 Tax=Cynara cardunculus var. scolymus TaxID=59895 RepID=A0A103Y7W4_CYNCS|nr:protein of unknown function DUF1731, C-terminal [Cynara cardunculus var. scolymus]